MKKLIGPVLLFLCATLLATPATATWEHDTTPASDVEPPKSSFSAGLWLSIRGEASTQPFTMGLCAQECFTNGTIDAAKTGRFDIPTRASVGSDGLVEFSSVAQGTYRVAVHIPAAKTSGYLVRDAKVYRVVPFDRASVITVGASHHSQTFDIAIGDPPRHGSADVSPKAVSTGGSFSHFAIKVIDASANTRVQVQVVGCGRNIVYDKTFTGSRTFAVDARPDRRKMGSDWRLRITVRELGYDPKVFEAHRFAPLDWGFSCRGVAKPAVPSSWVASWSKKSGSVRTGSTVAAGKKAVLTRTTLSAPGRHAKASVRYRWRVDGATVATSRKVRLRSSWRGKRLAATVSVTAPGHTARTRTITYGKIRR